MQECFTCCELASSTASTSHRASSTFPSVPGNGLNISSICGLPAEAATLFGEEDKTAMKKRETTNSLTTVLVVAVMEPTSTCARPMVDWPARQLFKVPVAIQK